MIPIYQWIIFGSIIATLIIIDLSYTHTKTKNHKQIDMKYSLGMSLFFIIIALLFSCWIGWWRDTASMANFLTSYLVEKTLSLDNIFMISLVFSSFKISLNKQHDLLMIGIISAIILRGLLIFGGIALVKEFSWLLSVFSVFLIIAGIKLLFPHKEAPKAANKILNMLKKTKLNKKVAAIIAIEAIDIMFALDSIPAVLNITTDAFTVYTSNIFAILGLRALYFSLAILLQKFCHLQYALAGILIFIGSKSFIIKALGLQHFPAMLSLVITITMLMAGIISSHYAKRRR
jgi:tellurite resistance protein TerC